MGKLAKMGSDVMDLPLPKKHSTGGFSLLPEGLILVYVV